MIDDKEIRIVYSWEDKGYIAVIPNTNLSAFGTTRIIALDELQMVMKLAEEGL